MNYDFINHLYVDGHKDRWYIILGEWDNKYAGPYKTAAAAKGQLTLIKKGR